MREKSHSIKLGYKVFGWGVVLVFMFGGIYFLDSSIRGQGNAPEKLDRWCYSCFSLSAIFFFAGIFLLWAIYFYFSLKISFVGDEILIKKLTGTHLFSKEMIDDVAILKGGCWIYLKSGTKFFIPSELTDFRDVLRALKKFRKKTDVSLFPSLGSYQGMIGKKKKRR